MRKCAQKGTTYLKYGECLAVSQKYETSFIFVFLFNVLNTQGFFSAVQGRNTNKVFVCEYNKVSACFHYFDNNIIMILLT